MDKEQIAIYPGTFDPLTSGHECIIKRALSLFENVIVAVAGDCNKNTLFSLEERVKIIEEVFEGNPGVKVLPFSGLLVNFALEHHSRVLIRGLRAVSDFDYEFQMALMNHSLQSEVQTIFLMSELQWMYISSTFVRNVASLGGDVSAFVPQTVIPHLRKVYSLPDTWPHLTKKS